jgi:serine/threonine protein kinase
VRAIIDAGLHRLTDEALQELSNHLDACSDCFKAFDRFYPVALVGDSSGADSSMRSQQRGLLSDLVDEVLAEYKRQHFSKSLMVVSRHPSPGFDRAHAEEYDWQLVRGQALEGKLHRYEVLKPIGRGDFTETYAAEQLLEHEHEPKRRRVVLKVARVADDMSPDAAIARLELLQRVIQVHAQRLQNLSGLRAVAQMIDCGRYIHRLHNESTDSTFLVYESIDGQDLAAHMAEAYPTAGGFRGLPSSAAFAAWARMLTEGLAEIHAHLVVHGDIRPKNILVTAAGRPVFIDVGQSLFREVMNGANAFRGAFYRAPEGIGTSSSDLFSLGGLLFFLATGREPIGLTYSDRELLKQQISLQVKEANPTLYCEDIGVADIIAMCLRKEGRVLDAGRLLDEVDTFWPESSPVSMLDELKSLTDPAAGLDAGGNSMYLAVAVSDIRSLRRKLSEMAKGVLDVSGSPEDIRYAACRLLRTLRAGDEFFTISHPAFWFPDNIGTNGRFLTMCRNAAARGALVRRVLLIRDDLSDPHLEAIVAAQLNAAAELDPTVRSNFVVRYVLMSDEARRKLVTKGRHFGLLVRGRDRIAMFPVYDTNGRLVTLRFRSGVRQVEGLQETFESIWSAGKPLVDLQLPSATNDLDAERVG